ncbi:hypothetical protein A7U60_g7646 [Sanghuangporus baumii]|uniref:Uncharacterized protein n=1 Tax=Sanghuangporus baumii TaxID=108892 RepID=A0A9Q5HSZ5_SANBA|nr:hypothetical protein A7U60_g7646 [Sanghuangporus baumii]
MSILCSILSHPLRIFIPAGLFYEQLSAVDETDENPEMTADRTRSPEPYGHGSSGPFPQARRRPARTGSTANRSSWFQSMSFEVLPNIPFWTKAKGRQREDDRKIQRKNHRQSPKGTLPTLPDIQQEEEETSRNTITCNRDDQSKRLFQDTLDLCSETDVINACRALNEKINDVALSLVDEWVETPSISRLRIRSGSSSGLGQTEAEYLRNATGQCLYNLIRSKRSLQPSSEVQNWVTDALQAVAAYELSVIISSTFCPGLSSQADVEMKETFENMLRSESLPAALRWRALTYTHSASNCKSENVKNFATKHVEDLACQFQSVFVLAGEKNSSVFMSRIQEVVAESEIIESAMRLSEILKTKLFSIFLDIHVVHPSTDFREDIMKVETNSTLDAVRARPVLCTLEIGLREVPPQDRSGRILLKTKVALAP